MLLALPPVDESSLSYLIGYWGARIGIPLVVVVLVTRFIVGQVRGPRTPTSSAHFGVTGASAQAQWPAPPTPAQWFSPPDSGRPTAPAAVTQQFTQPAKGRHAK